MSARSPSPIRNLIGFVLAAVGIAASGVLFAQMLATDQESAILVSDVADLEDWFACQQELFLPIIPPGDAPFQQTSTPAVLPFDMDGLPKAILKNMPGRVEHDCPVLGSRKCRLYL